MNECEDRRSPHTSADGCLVYGAALPYSAAAAAQVCDLCGREQTALFSCPEGHFICDACHCATAMDVVRHVLETTPSSEPLAILERILALPALTMHGPEHHAIVPGVVVAAARNAGAAVPPGALDTALGRGAKVPGGWCGYCGACGAAIGAGVAMSVMTGRRRSRESSALWRSPPRHAPWRASPTTSRAQLTFPTPHGLSPSDS